MNVYANELTQEVIIREFPYAFTEHKISRFAGNQLKSIDTEPFTVGDIHCDAGTGMAFKNAGAGIPLWEVLPISQMRTELRQLKKKK